MGKKKKKSSVKRKNRKMMEKKLKKNKRVEPTFSKKKTKELNKELEKNSEIAALKKARKECNHNLNKTTAFVNAAEYSGENEYLIRNLSGMKSLFGEENVGVCTTCRIAVPSMGVLMPEDVSNTALVLTGAIEHIVNSTSSEKEVESLHKGLSDAMDFIKTVSKKYSKIRSKKYGNDICEMTASPSTVSGKPGIDYSKITQ